MEFHVYKCRGCLYYNIGHKIVDESVIVLVESDFQKSWVQETYDCTTISLSLEDLA